MLAQLSMEGKNISILTQILKRGTHLGFKAMKMLKTISLAHLTQVET